MYRYDSTFTLTVQTAETWPQATFDINVTAIDPPSITLAADDFCEGGSVTLTSSSASGNQWYLDGNPIGGATNQSYNANTSGNYVVSVNAAGCPNNPSTPTTVTVNPTPTPPTITPDGPTTFCAGGDVTLTSSSASGNQWYLNGNPIGGATNQTYMGTASGNYTCATDGTAARALLQPQYGDVTRPRRRRRSPWWSNTFCAGGTVTLTEHASGNQWYLDRNPIGSATNQAYNGRPGTPPTTVTANGCPSAPSAATTLT